MKLAIHGAILAGAILLQTGCGGGGGSVPVCTGNFTPCGGDLTGKWSVDSVCTEGDIQDAFDTSDLPAECKGMVQSFSIDMSGTLEYASGTETSDLTMNMSATFSYSKACIQAMAGGVPIEVTAAMCESVSSSSDGAMTCKLSNGGCACTMAQTDRSQGTAAYTTSGGVLSYVDGGDPMEYCVSGTSLTFRGAIDSGGVAMRIKTHRM